MKLRVLLAACALPALVCAAERKQDQAVVIGTEDQEMRAAIAHARATLDDFLKLHAAPPAGASKFKIKVGIHYSEGTEYMWVTPFEQTAQGFKGVLADEPEYATSVQNGQTVSFSRADISDWGYVQDGKQKGSFTVCVLFRHMPKDDVEQYRRDYGFEC